MTTFAYILFKYHMRLQVLIKIIVLKARVFWLNLKINSQMELET